MILTTFRSVIELTDLESTFDQPIINLPGTDDSDSGTIYAPISGNI